jgi:hypothetical protein
MVHIVMRTSWSTWAARLAVMCCRGRVSSDDAARMRPAPMFWPATAALHVENGLKRGMYISWGHVAQVARNSRCRLSQSCQDCVKPDYHASNMCPRQEWADLDTDK